MIKKYFNGRIKRAEFIIYGAIPILFLNFLAFFVNASDGQTQYDTRAGIAGLFVLLLLPLLVISTIKRLHDLGRSGWYTALLLVPFVSAAILAWLIFVKGEARDNKYGENPYTQAERRV